MRLFGKSVYEKNGYPWVGTVKIMKNAVIRETTKGRIWQAFCTFESPPKGDTSGRNALWIKAYAPLSNLLVEWEKGTNLFVAGTLHKDAFWSKQGNGDVYSLNCEYVAEQLDYTTMYASTSRGTNIPEQDEDTGTDYNPDF